MEVFGEFGWHGGIEDGSLEMRIGDRRVEIDFTCEGR